MSACHVASAVVLAAAALAGTVRPAAGADPTLAVSAPEIATGQVVSASGANCASDGDIERSLRAVLVIGEPGSQVAAAYSDGLDGGPAPLGVPGWVDVDASAEVHAWCFERGADGSVTSAFEYEPLGIDITPGTGPSPAAVPERVERIEGQATKVEVTDCDPAADQLADGVLFAGTDLSGASWSDPVAVAETSATASTITVVAHGIDGRLLPPGSYVLVARCGTASAGFSAPPTIITVSSNAAVDGAGLSITDDGRGLVASGGWCTTGDVSVTIVALPAAAEPQPSVEQRLRQAEGVGEAITQSVSPAPDGSWTLTWVPELLAGHASLFAVCGDPTAAGFAYADAGLIYAIEPPVAPVPSTVPALPDVAAPAGSVPPATPIRSDVRYAG